ncbi:hypothetical protein [Blastopirellula marina]|uniref:DUF3150 domain-containing protein n=1 Tax=Blastopirellula marina TaxID=124 RepID=A0A2S8FAI9_9BACT|nr:hypothetical protein [Blastopirellula marina]PQO28944.1 hypothetical protein C5Y98_24605 [Blastopirellula marina]PTL42217.1 hypothetical protein C5Y97_24620 [Blastopirellula marina]
MTLTVDGNPSGATTTPSSRLQTTMAAARLSFTWLGVRKSLSSHQREQAADSFGAEGKYLSAGKKLLDTSHPAFKAVTSVRSRTVSFWKGVSLPYPEPGIRLIRQDAIAVFDSQIAEFKEELSEAVVQLDQHFGELRQAARIRLGDLYCPDDYPHSLIGMFAIEHDYPSVEPPDYLRRLNPALYEQECRRMQSRFDDAIHMAEQAFLEEISRLIEHLTERLSGDSDGKPKVFRDSAIGNLTEFFERFRQLNVRSNPQLDELVDRACQVVSGIQPHQLRDSSELRQRVANQLGAVQSSLDGLLVDRPRRNILRRPR